MIIVAQSFFVAQVRSACKVSTENNNVDWFGTLLRSACKVSDDWLPAEPQKWRGAPGVEAAEKEESSNKNCPDMKMWGPTSMCTYCTATLLACCVAILAYSL